MSKQKANIAPHTQVGPHWDDKERAQYEAGARELTADEAAAHTLAEQEGITTAAAAEKIRYSKELAKLSAKDTKPDVSAALLPAESEPGADRA